MKIADATAYIWHVKLSDYRLQRRYFESLLSESEKLRAGRFRFERDAEQFILARGILRLLLGQLLDQPADRLQLYCTAYGKPVLQGNSSLQFNLSHSRDRAVYAFSVDTAIGVDVEYQNPQCDIVAVSRGFFSAREYQLLQNMETEAKTAAFFRAWVQKEAILKALGWGMFYPLSQIEVALSPGPMGWVSTSDPQLQCDLWSLHDIGPAPGFAAALAVQAPLQKLEICTLPSVCC